MNWRHNIAADHRGFALVAVLWGLALLAIMAANFATETRTGRLLARNLIENAQAEALADAGVHRVIILLLHQAIPEGWRSDGTVYDLTVENGVLRVSIQDEGGRVDLNAARVELLRGLFVTVGESEQEATAIADAVADFRDADQERGPAGAEDVDYQAAGLDFGAKDGRFEAVEELQQVLGVSLDLYRRVSPFLTVYSNRGQVDPATAPREVLLAVPGLTEADVDALSEERSLAGGSPFGGLASVPSGGQGFLGTSRRRVSTVRAEAHLPSGAVFVREAVVQVVGAPDLPIRILAWRQGEAAASPPQDDPQ